MKEEQVYAIPFVTNTKALLSADETEITAQFQEEGLQMTDERLFQVGFGVFILEAEEFK